MADIAGDFTYKISFEKITDILKLLERAQEYINEPNQEQRKNLKNKLLYEVTEKKGIFKIFEFLLLSNDNPLKQNSSSMNYIAYSKSFEIYKVLFLIAIDFEYTDGIQTYFAKLEEILQKSRELTSIREARSQESWDDPIQHQNAVDIEENLEANARFEFIFKKLKELFKLAYDNDDQLGKLKCFQNLLNIFGILDKSNKTVLNTYLKDLIVFMSELNDKNLNDLIYWWAIENYGKEYVDALWVNQTQNIQRSTT